jgi:septum formation protein
LALFEAKGKKSGVKMTTQLLLASSSPRRQELLSRMGYSFLVIVPNIEEKQRPNETPAQYVLRNAQEKAQAALLKHQNPFCVALAADTIVVSATGLVLEKPQNREDAIHMLTLLSGQMHHVLTGYALVSPQTLWETQVVETQVYFRALENSEITAYIDTEDVYDKAGAYGIQEGAMGFVDSIIGSYTNIIGLPLSQIISALKKHLKINPAFLSVKKDV